MSEIKDNPPDWRGVVLSIKGGNIWVSSYSISPTDLIDLFYAALENIPHASIAMELALEKYNRNRKP